VQDPVVCSLLQQGRLSVEGDGESSLLRNLSLPTHDAVNPELMIEPVGPDAAYTSSQTELPPHLRSPVYPGSSLFSDVHQIIERPPNTLMRIPPPSLTLQPPTSPPCVQSFEDEFQPSSPSDIMSHYGFSSNLSSPGIGSYFSHSPSSVRSPQPHSMLAAAPGSPQPPPSCYKRHLSWPTSPSQHLLPRFDFLTPPMRSPVALHPPTFPLSPPVPLAPASSAASGDTSHRRVGGAPSSLLPPTSPRHMLTVPIPSSPCRSPSHFGPSLQPYQQSRSRSPSPLSEFSPCSPAIPMLSKPVRDLYSAKVSEENQGALQGPLGNRIG